MFQGFDPRVVDFMWGIRFNNDRAWFEAHKQEYLDWFYKPMGELGRQVFAVIQEENRDLALRCKVSRIYRDARRLHGRGPYKDHLWLSIERPHDIWDCEPVFWFELQPEGWSYGLGYWYMPPLTAAKFRARLDADPKTFEKLARALCRREDLVLTGEEYKRPKGQAPSKLLEPWYNRKGLSIGREAPHEEILWSSELADTLIEAYRFLTPYYRYFLALEGDRDPSSSQSPHRSVST